MNRIKKVLCVALVLVLLFASVPAIDVSELGFGMTASALNATGKCGENATYTFDSATGRLVINGTGKIGQEAFYNNQEIKDVIIGNEITQIGDYAFDKSSISSIVFGSNVEIINNGAFRDCDKLKSVVIPDSVWYMSASAFSYCDSLETIKIGTGLTSLSGYVFYSCNSLTSVVIPGNITIINNMCFASCQKLKTVVLENGVKSINMNAFNNCPKLESINIPKSVNFIGTEAFRYCSSLYDVYYAGSAEEWGLIEIRENNTGIVNSTIHFAETHTHTWDVEEITKDPTCTEKGEKVIKCKNAICEKLEEIPATGHEWIHASCTTPKTCNKCGVTEGEALGHTFTEQKLGEKYLKTPATCGKKAVYYYSCSACSLSSGETNESKTFEYGTAPDHNWGTAVKVEATCTEDEMMVQTCSRCNQKYVKKTSVKALGHSYGTDGKCKNAGCTETCPHSGEKEALYGKPATCTNPGVTDGEKCKYCGAVTKIQTVIPALGHTFKDYKSDGNATCIKDGTMTATCEICKTAKDTKTEVGSKERAGHTPDTDGIRCTLCGVELVCVHVYSKEKLITKTPTCTVEGQKAIVCSKCNANKPGSEEVIPALGHDKKITNAIPPTCVYEGYHVYTCARCGIEDREKLPALGHDYTYTSDGNATCTQDGTKTGKCKNCPQTIKGEPDPGSALGHSFTKYVSNNDATCTDNATEWAACDRGCGAKDIVKIPGSELGHKIVTIAEKAATCTEPGITRSEMCYRCKRVFIEPKEIPALGHLFTTEKVIIKAPTCIAEGKKAIRCERCHAIEPGTEEVIPATHSYPDNWSVVIAPDCQNTGFAVKVCFSCHDVIAQKVPKAGHADLDGDSKCDTCEMIIVVEPEEPTEPDTPDIPDVPEEKPCDCDCHAGGIKAFFFNFLNFFAKLFDKSARVCKCGASH